MLSGRRWSARRWRVGGGWSRPRPAGGVVGEHRVVAVDREQLTLALRGGGVLPAYPAHDQPGGDLLAAGPPDERGVADPGDLRLADQRPGVRVFDRVRVDDVDPVRLADAGDRRGDR